MFPDDCIQSVVGSGRWWDEYRDNALCRGALIFAFVPHFDQLPYTFEPVGRADATSHTSAIVKVSPLKIDQALKRSTLPVAAMPLHEGEVWAAYRAKRRPCVVLGCNHPTVESGLTRGMPKNSTAPTIIVAPYYGAKKGNRAGYRPEFVERVRHCEYPQFVWDFLPFTEGEESILRLDQLQPIGAHYGSYKLSGFKLSNTALEVMDELLTWLIRGGVPKDSLVAMYRQEIEAAFSGGSN
jgi:hypothetical protein